VRPELGRPHSFIIGSFTGVRRLRTAQ